MIHPRNHGVRSIHDRPHRGNLERRRGANLSDMTADPAITVAAAVLKSNAAIAVFEKYGIDYYCGGSRGLEEVCSEIGVASEDVEREIAAAATAEPSARQDWNAASLRDLIRHIVSTHHIFLKTEMPRVSEMISQVVGSDDSKRGASLEHLKTTFSTARRELELHMQKEEAVLFPMIERYEAAALASLPLPALPFGTIENPIGMMEAEHASTANDLRTIRDLMQNIAAPNCGSAAVNALSGTLCALESDLHVHMHLENNILFPRVISLEAASRSGLA